MIRENVRRIDTPARLGGDEFVVLLPETDRDGARVVADKIRQGVAAAGLGERGERIPIARLDRARRVGARPVARRHHGRRGRRHVRREAACARRRPNGRTALEAVGPGRPPRPSAAERARGRVATARGHAVREPALTARAAARAV